MTGLNEGEVVLRLRYSGECGEYISQQGFVPVVDQRDLSGGPFAVEAKEVRLCFKCDD